MKAPRNAREPFVRKLPAFIWPGTKKTWNKELLRPPTSLRGNHGQFYCWESNPIPEVFDEHVVLILSFENFLRLAVFATLAQPVVAQSSLLGNLPTTWAEK